MNTIRVPISAGLKLGLVLTAILMMMMFFRPATGPEVVVTVTGILYGGRDDFGIFGMGRVMPKGTPYTLIFTFDDTKGKPMPARCPGSGSGIVGSGQFSPATAVLTINDKSYGFGNKPDARSKTWRHTPSVCSESEIGIAVEEGPSSLASGVNIRIGPNRGDGPLTQDGDWRDALSLSRFNARSGENAFAIRRPWNYSAETMSYFSVDSITISGPQKASAER